MVKFFLTMGDRIKNRHRLPLYQFEDIRIRKYPQIDSKFDQILSLRNEGGYNENITPYAEYIEVEYVVDNKIESFFVTCTICYWDEEATEYDDQSYTRFKIYVTLQDPIPIDDFLDTTPGFVLQRPWRNWTVVSCMEQ